MRRTLHIGVALVTAGSAAVGSRAQASSEFSAPVSSRYLVGAYQPYSSGHQNPRPYTLRLVTMSRSGAVNSVKVLAHNRDDLGNWFRPSSESARYVVGAGFPTPDRATVWAYDRTAHTYNRLAGGPSQLIVGTDEDAMPVVSRDGSRVYYWARSDTTAKWSLVSRPTTASRVAATAVGGFPTDTGSVYRYHVVAATTKGLLCTRWHTNSRGAQSGVDDLDRFDFATQSFTRLARLRDTKYGSGFSVRGGAESPDGKTLALALQDRYQLALLSTTSWKVRYRLYGRRGGDVAEQLTWSPNSQQLTLDSSEGTIRYDAAANSKQVIVPPVTSGREYGWWEQVG